MAAASSSEKRKSESTEAGPSNNAGATSIVSASKKARTDFTYKKQAVEVILASPTHFPAPTTGDAIRNLIVEIAAYARHLEASVEATEQRRKAKSNDEIQAEANKLRDVVSTGIKRHMSWKPTAKMSRAKWNYDGVCSDPLVFGKLMGIDGPPTFKMKKYPKDEFESLLGGQIVAPLRFANGLFLTSDVTVRWDAEEYTFKFNGLYGKE